MCYDYIIVLERLHSVKRTLLVESVMFRNLETSLDQLFVAQITHELNAYLECYGKDQVCFIFWSLVLFLFLDYLDCVKDWNVFYVCHVMVINSYKWNNLGLNAKVQMMRSILFRSDFHSCCCNYSYVVDVMLKLVLLWLWIWFIYYH